MKQPKERVIYDNYDLWSNYEEVARENIEIDAGRSEPDDNAVWKEIYALDECEWGNAKTELERFFAKGTWIIQGMIETWRGCRRVVRSFTISILFLTKQPRIVITSKSGMRMDICI